MKGVDIMYAIVLDATMNNFYNRANTYKTAIENCKDFEHLYRILSGFARLAKEWLYVSRILAKFNYRDPQIKVLAYTKFLCDIRDIAKNKILELSD